MQWQLPNKQHSTAIKVHTSILNGQYQGTPRREMTCLQIKCLYGNLRFCLPEKSTGHILPISKETQEVCRDPM